MAPGLVTCAAAAAVVTFGLSPIIHARPLHDQIAGSRLVVLKDAGHMTHWTATARVIREIEAVAAKGR